MFFALEVRATKLRDNSPSIFQVRVITVVCRNHRAAVFALSIDAASSERSEDRKPTPRDQRLSWLAVGNDTALPVETVGQKSVLDNILPAKKHEESVWKVKSKLWMLLTCFCGW